MHFFASFLDLVNKGILRDTGENGRNTNYTLACRDKNF